MYADQITGSMKRTIEETNRRRKVQKKYNSDHNITPVTVIKPVKDLIETTIVTEAESSVAADNRADYATKKKEKRKLTNKDKEALIRTLTKQMQDASKTLDFERAAELRDIIFELQGTREVRKK